MKIADILNCGRDNALSLNDLTGITGLKSRDVRLMIERERRAGALILSDNTRGYFLPDREDDVASFVSSMRHRAGEILKTADCVARSAGFIYEKG